MNAKETEIKVSIDPLTNTFWLDLRYGNEAVRISVGEEQYDQVRTMIQRSQGYGTLREAVENGQAELVDVEIRDWTRNESD